MIIRYQFSESLRAEVAKIYCHILRVLPKDRIIHSLFEGVVKFFNHIRWSAFRCCQSTPHPHDKIDPLFFYRGTSGKSSSLFSAKRAMIFNFPA